MAAKKEIICACGCGRTKMVRVADINRGWGKYYSKSCKATAQERRTGQHYKHLAEKEGREMSPSFDSGYFGHGQN